MEATEPDIAWMGPYVPYDRWNVDASVPHRAGVYVIWHRPTPDGTWKLAYVGRAGDNTDDLHDRLVDHLAPTEPNPCIKNLARDGRIGLSGFSYAELPQEAHRECVETYLWGALKPECNKNDPGGTPCLVTPPKPPPG